MVQHHEECEISTQTIDRGKPHRWRTFVFKYKRDFDRQECQQRQSDSEDRIRNIHIIGKVGYFAIICWRDTIALLDLHPILREPPARADLQLIAFCRENTISAQPRAKVCRKTRTGLRRGDSSQHVQAPEAYAGREPQRFGCGCLTAS